MGFVGEERATAIEGAFAEVGAALPTIREQTDSFSSENSIAFDTRETGMLRFLLGEVAALETGFAESTGETPR